MLKASGTHGKNKIPQDIETMSDDEIAQFSQAFSFDIDLYSKRLRGAPNWTKVIVATIYADHVLTELIKENTVDPEYLVNDKRRKYMIDKLEICLACGFVPSELGSCLTKLNAIRNRLAHKLDFEVSQKEITDLSNTVPKGVREAIQKVSKRRNASKGDFLVSEVLLALVVFLDILRQKLEERRLLAAKHERRLNRVISEIET